jgi:hypothetical protein
LHYTAAASPASTAVATGNVCCTSRQQLSQRALECAVLHCCQGKCVGNRSGDMLQDSCRGWASQGQHNVSTRGRVLVSCITASMKLCLGAGSSTTAVQNCTLQMAGVHPYCMYVEQVRLLAATGSITTGCVGTTRVWHHCMRSNTSVCQRVSGTPQEPSTRQASDTTADRSTCDPPNSRSQTPNPTLLILRQKHPTTLPCAGNCWGRCSNGIRHRYT